MAKGSAGSLGTPAPAVVRSSVRLLSMLTLLALLCTPAAAAPRQASVLLDAGSGKVLHSSNADASRYPASLTKMMTLYLLFEQLGKGTLTLQQSLTVSQHAATQPPTNLNLDSGDTITIDTAIRALIVRSANDVATVVAEAIGGTEAGFARLMTSKAHALGMKRTVFRNASGLPDPGQVSTARDLALLARALVRDFPQYYGYFALTRFTYEGRTYVGHNRLMTRYAGADGLKTGYIRASGYNLAASAARDGRRLIGIVLGGTSPGDRDRKMAGLLDKGFGRLPKSAEPVLVASAPAARPAAKAAKRGPELAIPLPKPSSVGGAVQVAAASARPAKIIALALPLAKPTAQPAVAVAQLASVQSVASLVVEAEPAVAQTSAGAPATIVEAAAPSSAQPADPDARLVIFEEAPAAIGAAPTVAQPAPAAPAPVIIEVAATEQPAAVVLAQAATAAPDVPSLPITALVAAEGVEPAQTAGEVPPAPLGRSMGSMWTLQVGAFSRFAAAHTAVSDATQAVPKLLAKAEIHIEEAQKNGATIYRAQFVGLSEETAKEACQGLKAKELACIVLSPRLAIAEAAS